MKLYFILILNLFHKFAFSQNICFQVKDNQNTPVSFATVKFTNRFFALNTNEIGEFCLRKFERNDTLIISAIGFQKKLFPYSEFINSKNNIILNQQIIDLKEIVISSTKNKTAKFGYFKPKIYAVQNSFGPNSMLPIGTFIENSNPNEVGIIKTITIGIDNNKKNIYGPYKLRIRLFENSNENKPSNIDLCLKNIICDTENNKNEITIDIGDLSIPFDNKGIWVTVESLGRYNFDGTFIPNQFGELGKSNYKKNKSNKIKSIESIAPKYFMAKNKTSILAVSRTFSNKWVPVWNHGNSNLVPMIGIEIEY